jgi:glycosyltransferase involved in cell wall biosynthesis
LFADVRSWSGWFSERSTCYLALGKPVITQDTGFSRVLPVGEGLLAWRNLDEAVAAIEALNANYERHCHAARAIAEAYFDSDRVLSELLEVAFHG